MGEKTGEYKKAQDKEGVEEVGRNGEGVQDVEEVEDQEEKIKKQAEKAGANNEIDINKFIDQEEVNQEDKEEFEKELMGKIEEEQKKGTTINISALVRMGAVYTAKYVPPEDRTQYIDEYCELIGGFLNMLEVKEALSTVGLKQIGPEKRIIIGFVGFLAGSIFLPLSYKKKREKEKEAA